MTYAEKIKAECYKKGITPAQLERDLGLSNGFVSKQKGKIKSYILEKIAEYLGIAVTDLVLEGDEMTLSIFSNNSISKHAEFFAGASKPSNSKALIAATEKSQAAALDYVASVDGLGDILIEVESLSPTMQQACLEKMAAMIQKFKELDNM